MGILGSITSGIKAAVGAVADVVTSSVAEVAKGVAGAAASIVSDTFEIGNKLTGGLLEKVGDFMGGSLGTMLNKGLDALGLPDWVGDIAGATLDFCTGNYVGAAANALDALEDVAKACGGDELAAFLKTGSEITNMFSPAGAANLGKIGEIANTATAIMDKIEVGMGALDKLQSGDIMGAGADIFKLAGVDAGEFAESIGKAIDPDLTSMVISCFGQAETAMSYLDDPVKGVQDLLQGPLKEFAPAASSMFDFAKDISDRMSNLGGALPANFQEIANRVMGPITQSLMSGLEGMAKGQSFSGSVLQSGRDMMMHSVEQAMQQLVMCNENRQAFSDIADLLRQAAARLETVDLHSHHGTAIRA